MARHVEDLIALMPLLAHSDGRDQTVIDMPLGDPARVDPEKLRIAFYTDGADEEVAAVVRAAARSVNAAEARPDGLDAAYDLEMGLIGADGGDALRQFSPVHPLLTGWVDKLEAYRVDIAGFARLWDRWQQYKAELLAFPYDAIVCPVYAHPALEHGKSVEDANFRGFAHTMAFNVAGWPAAVVCGGMSRAGLPVGVQIAAKPWREDVALTLSRVLHRLPAACPPLHS